MSKVAVIETLDRSLFSVDVVKILQYLQEFGKGDPTGIALYCNMPTNGFFYKQLQYLFKQGYVSKGEGGNQYYSRMIHKLTPRGVRLAKNIKTIQILGSPGPAKILMLIHSGVATLQELSRACGYHAGLVHELVDELHMKKLVAGTNALYLTKQGQEIANAIDQII